MRESPGNSDTSVAINTFRAQVLVSKYHFQQKEQRLFGETAASRVRTGLIQNKLTELCVVPGSKEVFKRQKRYRNVKGTQELT
jgi:hypothetical protein